MTNNTSLKKRIGTKVATLGPKTTVHEDSIYGDEAPLILVVNGEVVAADCYEVSDYKMMIENEHIS